MYSTLQSLCVCTIKRQLTRNYVPYDHTGAQGEGKDNYGVIIETHQFVVGVFFYFSPQIFSMKIRMLYGESDYHFQSAFLSIYAFFYCWYDEMARHLFIYIFSISYVSDKIRWLE